jgi:hypothetical protein
MNENAKAWVAALRSGEFKQGKNVLRSNEDYCCLGVACELYHRQFEAYIWESFENPEEDNDEMTVYSFDGDDLQLAERVREWLGLATNIGAYRRGADDPISARPSLAEKNDTGAKFEEIADIIEREPDGLFVS